VSTVATLLAQAPAPADTVSLGEAVVFWILGPLAVAGGLGMVFARNAVHSALWLVLSMLSLGLLYMVQQGPFLGFVQIIVYTGAIMMLFLFVLMLVGVDASDSVVETIRGQRVLATLLGLGLGVVLVLALGQMSLGAAVGLSDSNAGAGGNIQALADIMFSRYVFAFETTSALLITAALGAMVLAHRERLVPKPTQQSMAAQRIRDYADKGAHLGPLPAPGVFARHNAVDTPALLPDGTAAESSISRVLAARGTVRSAPALAENIEEIQRSIEGASASGPGPAPAHTEEDVR